MTALNARKLLSLALGLAASTWAAGAAGAASIEYGTVGSVAASDAGTKNLVYFQEAHGTASGQGSIDLGHFVVSALAKTTNATFTDAKFQEIVYAGSDQSVQVNGVINGSFGPSVASPSLKATITSITSFGNEKLPFDLQLPIGSAMNLAISNGNGPATTTLSGALGAAAEVVNPSVAPVPEPATVALFAVAFGGLGLWNRRRGPR